MMKLGLRVRLEAKSGKAHLSGKVAAALKEKADLFAKPPVVKKVDILAAKPSR